MSRNKRVHNVREDVVKSSTWGPHAPSESKAAGLTVLLTPEPTDLRVCVQYDAPRGGQGRRATPLIKTLLQDYKRTGEVPYVVEGALVTPPAIVAERLPEAPTSIAAQPADPIVSAPEDAGVRVYVFRGRPCVIAAAVGRALGYADKSLIKRIRGEWAGEMIEGKDFALLSLAEAQEMLAGGVPESGTLNPRGVLALFESGWDLVCIKTEKPEGKRLRRRLADEVMPKIRRDQAAPPLSAPAPSNDVVVLLASVVAQMNERADREDAREQARMAREDARDASMRDFMLKLVERQMAAQPSAPAALPQPERKSAPPAVLIPRDYRNHDALTKDVNGMLRRMGYANVSKNAVGRAIMTLKVRDRREVARYVMVPKPGGGDLTFDVPKWFYAPSVTNEIVKYIVGSAPKQVSGQQKFRGM